MKHKSKRWICTILTSVLVLTNADVSIFASETDEVIESTESTEVNETIELPETTEMEQENTEIIDEDMQYEEVIEDTDATEKIETTENVTLLDDEKNGSAYELETLELDEDDDLVVTASESEYQYIVLKDGTIGLTEYIGEESELDIPSTIDGYTVTKLFSVFRDCKSLISVSIPESVTTIASNAFSDCTSLVTINIPESVTTIASNAFTDCTSLVTISIPESVTIIGGSAFARCTSLETINIPESVARIDGSTFEGCTSLETINIPECVTTIGDRAFEDCTSLETINIPESVTIIEPLAFCGCTSLGTISIPESVTTIGGGAFEDCTSLGTISIPESVTTIGNGMFEGCTSLGTINMPESVTIIEDCAFEGCTSLGTISIPESVTTIGNRAFYGCTSLGTINIPESVTTIGERAFYDCTSLGTVSIMDGVTAIEKETFEGCTSLETINIPGSVRIIGNSAFSDCTSLRNVNISDGVAEISEKAFFCCSSLEIISIPNSVKTIGTLAFYECKLKEVTIPDGVTTIGDSAFEDCKSLISVSIPDSVTTIEKRAFGGCENLETINIPNGITVIEEGVFDGCTSLEAINIPNSVSIIGKGAFNRCITLKEINIPNSVNIIGRSAFRDCETLKEIIIPDSVDTIEEYAFANCDQLRKAVIPASVTEMGTGVFLLQDYAQNPYYNVTIYGYKGSAAENHWIRYGHIGVKFVALDEEEKHTHSYTSKVTTAATTAQDGERTYSCSCGNSYAEVIHKVSTVALKETVYTYDGKEKKPAVTVKDSKGNTLKKDEDYTLTYADECKEPGTYTVEIAFKGNYYGTKSLTYTIENSHVHSYTSKVTTAATTAQDGERTYSCSCGNSYAEVIHKVSTVALKEKVYTYDGKEKKPAVTVKDSKGNALETNKDYTLAYQNECKNPGQYVVTVNFKGNYEGTKKLTYTINPKGVSLSKVTAEKTGFKATWKKGTEITGYQIQYATDSNFNTKKTESKTISKSSTTSQTISKLKAQKKYYVRIRSYKNINVDGKEQKLYSEWSEVKTVITENAKGKVSEVKIVKLSENSYVYNGKVRKPSVLVKDKKGNVLEKNKEYTVTYAKGCKNPGRYSVTIKFKGDYSGTKKKTLYFTIKPAKVSVSKVSAASKGFKAEWKKGTGVSGYEIQYSTSSKFTKKTTESKNISSGKTKSKKITKLSAKKKYYVRIRAYKTVKVDGKSVKLYSDWSKAKSVTTKK